MKNCKRCFRLKRYVKGQKRYAHRKRQHAHRGEAACASSAVCAVLGRRQDGDVGLDDALDDLSGVLGGRQHVGVDGGLDELS